jgi:hypothetical protein
VKEALNSYAKWRISGMKGEVETETSFSTLNIKNVSGPIVAHGGFGKMYIEFDQVNQSRPNSISTLGVLDITLPSDAKANLKVQAAKGDFFTDFDIVAAQVEKNSKDLESGKSVKIMVNSGELQSNRSVDSTTKDLTKSKGFAINYDSLEDTNVTIGTINGGGVDLIISSVLENVYLRKKK